MPRTSFVFLNDEPGLSEEQRDSAAQQEAKAALGAYWSALEGTIDPSKVENAAQNALIGNVQDVAVQICERFHKDDRIMAWFDFFNHSDSDKCFHMTSYMQKSRSSRRKNAHGGFVMTIEHDTPSAVEPGKPGSSLYPESPLGEQIEGIPTGREVA